MNISQRAKGETEKGFGDRKELRWVQHWDLLKPIAKIDKIRIEVRIVDMIRIQVSCEESVSEMHPEQKKRPEVSSLLSLFASEPTKH